MSMLYNNRGVMRSEHGDKQGAVADYTAALQLNPDCADAYRNRGNAREELGDQVGAASDWDLAAALEDSLGVGKRHNNHGVGIQP